MSNITTVWKVCSSTSVVSYGVTLVQTWLIYCCGIWGLNQPFCIFFAVMRSMSAFSSSDREGEGMVESQQWEGEPENSEWDRTVTLIIKGSCRTDLFIIFLTAPLKSFLLHFLVYRLLWFLNVFTGQNINTDGSWKGFTTAAGPDKTSRPAVWCPKVGGGSPDTQLHCNGALVPTAERWMQTSRGSAAARLWRTLWAQLSGFRVRCLV